MSTKWSTQVLGKSGGTDFGSLLKDEFAVILLQGKNVFNDIIYCYLKVMLPDMKKLEAALKGTENFNISDYGTVVAAGKGTPPEEVRAEIALTYHLFDQPRAIHTPSSSPTSIPNEKKAWDEY